MEWTYQPVTPEGRGRVFHDRLAIVCDVGVGLTSGQGSDPQIMLDYSDDGGITWLSLPNRSLGPIGQYGVQVHWDGLGSSLKPRVFRAAVSDPVKVMVRDTLWTGRGGTIG